MEEDQLKTTFKDDKNEAVNLLVKNEPTLKSTNTEIINTKYGNNYILCYRNGEPFLVLGVHCKFIL